jgi:histidyl-tRNA synthetase
MSKPGIPQGTRDFSPAEVRRRQYILNTLKNIFELYGFQPLETPSMENLNTLMGKYGEEGDRLIFKILNNGLDHPDKQEKSKTAFEKILSGKSTPEITERALRYDLTIPFARYVVMHQNEIAFPFRRYQMQPVWRADRPQRGRYREFWQCDCDVVGSNSLISEAELICIYQSAFQELALPVVSVKINSRKLLAGLAETAGYPEKMMEITIALDKLDKIGWEGVSKELSARGINESATSIIEKIISIKGSNEDVLSQLEEGMKDSPSAIAGLKELRETISYYNQLSANKSNPPVIDISLARGLNYYTGIILEVTTSAVKIGSIGGGGRYDDLTGLFGLKGVSGVGISFGIDRIYDVLEELNLFPEQVETGTKAMLINFGGANETYGLEVLQKLRSAGIASEIYPESAKFDKQMKYANKRGIQFVIMPGDEEREKSMVSIKDFNSGEQQMLSVLEVIDKLS